MKANEVYLITTVTEKEGEYPRGIYSTFEEAVKNANRMAKWGFDEDIVNIYLVTPDYEYDYILPCVWSKEITTGKMLIGKDSK